ncbi:MAG: cytochrome b/b6 domain-containing protein [Candidatus Eremiobacteraeota bacterium]|nr:cytochrome b/b6 domain-containing protein [Candidatus Eremiobacteraeota bacterium]
MSTIVEAPHAHLAADVDGPLTGRRIYRHAIFARATHWLWPLAMLVLAMSGLQIFNAAPYLDASDKSDPARRVLAFGAHLDAAGRPVGTTTIFGREVVTTHLFGYTDGGLGDEAPRAFPAWLTLPGYQDLADGRRWHLLFAWVLFAAWLAYIIGAAIRGTLGEWIVRPSDLPKLWPMQAYYLHLRPVPPPHGTYNPLQKVTYTVVLFGLFPLFFATGLALSPGIDAAARWLPALFGGRQFARTWHFAALVLLTGYVGTHLILVATTGAWNNVRSMLTGWYVLKPHDGVGP